MRKIHRAKVGVESPEFLIGCTGGVFDCMTFVDWFRDGASRHDIPHYEQQDMVALVLHESGLFLYDWQGVGVRVEDGLHAIGTGAAPALAALRYGFTPEESVEFACTVDVYSGGGVQVEQL